MDSLILEPTVKSPLFEFSPTGFLVIEGRAINQHAENEFLEAIDWVSNIDINVINLTVKLDFINISSSRQLLNLFNALEKNNRIDELNVHWYFDEDDADLIDTGLIFKEIFPEINFILYLV